LCLWLTGELALTILKRYVLHAWSLSSEHYIPNPQLDFLPQEQKDHIRRAMMDLLRSHDHILRDLAAGIVPKIAQADWPTDWPGFLEALSAVIAESTNVVQVISVLKVLRGTKKIAFLWLMGEFTSETLTDESYFAVAPPIIHRLLAMQNNPSLLIRAKAQSVFRACVEQLEMYKDTSTYQAATRSLVEEIMGSWVKVLNHHLGTDVTGLSGDDYRHATKLVASTYKVLPSPSHDAERVNDRHSSC
jgi:hypothetical protein